MGPHSSGGYPPQRCECLKCACRISKEGTGFCDQQRTCSDKKAECLILIFLSLMFVPAGNKTVPVPPYSHHTHYRRDGLMAGKQREEHGDGSGIIEAEDTVSSVSFCVVWSAALLAARRAANVSPVSLMLSVTVYSQQYRLLLPTLLGENRLFAGSASKNSFYSQLCWECCWE